MPPALVSYLWGLAGAVTARLYTLLVVFRPPTSEPEDSPEGTKEDLKHA